MARLYPGTGLGVPLVERGCPVVITNLARVYLIDNWLYAHIEDHSIGLAALLANLPKDDLVGVCLCIGPSVGERFLPR